MLLIGLPLAVGCFTALGQGSFRGYDKEIAMLFSCQWDKEKLEKAEDVMWFYVSSADRVRRVGPQILIYVIHSGVINPFDVK